MTNYDYPKYLSIVNPRYWHTLDIWIAEVPPRMTTAAIKLTDYIPLGVTYKVNNNNQQLWIQKEELTPKKERHWYDTPENEP